MTLSCLWKWLTPRPTRLSAKRRQLLKSWESLRLNAYQDQRGVWTIGYGSTLNVHPGDVITSQQAEARLDADLRPIENTIVSEVHVRLSQNQFDALVLLTYNIGIGDFLRSTLLAQLNCNKPCDEYFLEWDKTHVGGKLVVDSGLAARRQREMEIFMS